MEINSDTLKKSLHNLKCALKIDDGRLTDLLKLPARSQNDVKKIFEYLSEKLLDINYTQIIGACFKSHALLLVTSVMQVDEVDSNFNIYQRKCIALAILSEKAPEILRYARKYFTDKPAPFTEPREDATPRKRTKQDSAGVTDMLLIKSCYILLSCDPIYFRDLWDWSIFIEKYFDKGSSLQKLYANHIMAILTNMTSVQLKCLNENIPEDILLQFDLELKEKIEISDNNEVDNEKNNVVVNWDFPGEAITNIEGVLLPVYNKENSKFYNTSEENHESIVKVDSTKINLRSIALGISSGKAICLTGPVGCGKTTLVEYLARKTGRVFPKQLQEEKFNQLKEGKYHDSNKVKLNVNGNKRKGFDINNSSIEEDIFSVVNYNEFESNNGFLRIQLGDQTDSKMLLGQYRCTDVPGEFIWSPGVLTQAVMNGCWLLLEDLDSATQDTFNILSNLLENNFLSVPGFRDCVKIEPGFQLFATVRNQKSKNNSQKTIFSLLEKYLYTVNILPLSRRELCEIVGINYPKLSTIANRIVDVYLTFSSGNHIAEDSIRHQELEENSANKKDYIALPFEKVSISSLPNSGRLVSTRDLMKLCLRSNPMFSVTNAECAYFVFQNAVDVFCSYLPESLEKTKLITSIGAKLGIIQSRCEFFSNEYKPEVQINDDVIKVGRAELHTKMLKQNYFEHNMNGNFEVSNPCKKVKLSHNTEKTLISMRRKEKASTFSFTRITSCLLEKIAVSVNQNEPILLVGETGVGKTSSIQYLAEKTYHKLVVVNMNNQSDVSDLVGGFKPVDLSYVLAPLRSDFEYLFRKTFNETKNEKFLSKISICYNQNNFPVLIKAMLAIVDTVFQRARNGDFKNSRYRDYLGRWRNLQTKLLKLDAQLSKSINISFAFIPGSLVNCIKNGDWVLLDEINLASAETLECLSTILEPDGSVVLLEKGDFTPVKRHPDFRIFACMNPNTDIGKKDLPIGIRNRFTEFFVDELTTENDLILLVNDYLSNTGIKKTKVFSIVKLYKKLKSLSRLELNDGLGNRPVYSLRTLCRSLTICAKNLCGSVERNLYESFCLSFLTQLDPVSHKIVLELIKGAMLSDVKSVLSQTIPKPGEDYLNFEGYWIQKGPKEVLECENYILTESVKQNLKDLARIISIGKLPVLLQGPTSAGKTSLIEHVAKKSGNHYLRINNHEHTDLQEYIGAYTSDVSGKLSFKEGVLAQAMRNGFWIILDELNLASTDILEALNRVLDDNRELFIAETQTTIKAHPNFMLFATQNPPGLYGGRKTLSRAFKNRFIELHFSEIPKPELEIILEKRCFIPKSYAQKMVKCMSDLQVNRKTTTRNNFTLRDLFRWGNRYTYADKKLLEHNLYDWNQHLVDEGYLVLSAKVRTEIEVSIIEETLFNNFRKKISVQNLYSLNENTSLVTKHIIEKIHNYKNRSDIIWTQNMTRMAVLTAKALEFNEPVLLVGPTGCGKTTVCQVLADINKRNLRILNCHMHTEGADFLGGLRPYRNAENETESFQKKLFEWSDGPLVISMLDGSYFMADEISLAEDSVLERLNSVLEPERTVLLAEKGGIDSTVDSEVLSNVSKEFVIRASDGFQFLGTMNPGGDFGKKELSPALRNRFTEIWCKPSDSMDDFIHISANALKMKSSTQSENEIQQLATVLVEVLFNLKTTVEKFKFSVRDILAWANYITENRENPELSLPEILVFGLETIFLDSLEMLLHESLDSVEKIKDDIIEFAILKIRSVLHIDISKEEIEKKKGVSVQHEPDFFGIKPFSIKIHSQAAEKSKNFSYEAPTTRKNLFRLLSALTLQKAILLEGPPGVGKTSTVENLARAIGYKIVRINLCEHTDLADLFGTDLPAEEKAFEIRPTNEDLKEPSKLGSFSWRDGPLLAALKSENTWILLDELNLAPQSVLEGLNAILDHRGEVFIPELNKTFVLGKQTRIFACQNPLRQGGGRKGLPQSFLNRFTKVYLRKLNTEDLLFVVDEKYSSFFTELQNYFEYFFENIESSSENVSLFDIMNSRQTLVNISERRPSKVETDLSKRMVKFSEILDKGISDLEFGYKGGPFEINLRDIMRWCDLLVNPNTGFIIKTQPSERENVITNLFKKFDNFLLILYERMKLVYYQRMRSESDKKFVCNAFSLAFNCDTEKLNALSEDIGLYWTDSAIYLNDIVIKRDSIGNFVDSTLEKEEDFHYQSLPPLKSSQSFPLMLSSQRELLKNLAECVHMEKPVILCGPTDCGKTKIVDVLCTVSNQACNFDTIDDSVTGSFQQIDLNRHLEEVSQNVTSIFTIMAQRLTLKINYNKNRCKDLNNLIELFRVLKQYSDLATLKSDADELVLFKRRVDNLNKVIEKLLSVENSKTVITALKTLQAVLFALKSVVKNAESLNTGGHFEWVDSKIVKSLKYGQYICLEHVNLCSAAILDRLNPVFEPNGNLLLSEKGVMTGDDAEIVEKHKNFRAFLTMDPKNGELSRAMRNRCIEISLVKDHYTIDDLKIMIYENGIPDLYLVNTLLSIHQKIKELSELSNFSISHLINFSFLVSSYKKMGYDDKKAVYISGMEVYVYPSNVDLLGYGLLYYQNKIKDIIKNDSELIKKESNACNFGNLVITCSKLNSLSMIEIVCEPLNVMLKCYPEIGLVSSHLGELKHDLKNKDYGSYFDLVKCYMCLLYEASSFEDINKRKEYIRLVLNNSINNRNNPQKEFLKNLNDTFWEAIKSAKSKFEMYPKSLPWNSKLFSRIRDYGMHLKVDRKNELRLSAILFCHVLIDSIADQNVSKISKMSALAYSQAVTEKNINDSLNNSFLKHLYGFLKNLRPLIISIFNYIDLDTQQYISILVSLLWINRLHTCSKESLFKDKVLNNDLIDKLVLHFKWTEKHLLKVLEQLLRNYKQLHRELNENFKKLKDYTRNADRPLNLVRKTYYKIATSFIPFYAEEQITYYEIRKKFENLISLVPVFGTFSQDQLVRKFSAILTDESQKIKEIVLKKQPECLKHLQNIDLTLVDFSRPIPQNLETFLRELAACVESKHCEEAHIYIKEIQNDLLKLTGICDSQEEVKDIPYSVQLEILPLREYFLTKGLIKAHHDSSLLLNKIYCEEIPSLNLNAGEAFNILSSVPYNKFKELYLDILQNTNNINNSLEFEELIKSISTVNYRHLSTFHRIVVNILQTCQLTSLSVRKDVCRALQSKEGIEAEMSFNGPSLTSTIVNLAFQFDGKLRPIALSDLKVWQKQLNEIRQLIWNNSILTVDEEQESVDNLKMALLNSKKLLVEVQYIQQICQGIENEDFSEYNENFQKLVEKLTDQRTIASEFQKNCDVKLHSSSRLQINVFHAALINSLMGCIEICLLTFTPLIDPVEKNRLKNEYIRQDFNCLKTLTDAYDIMRAIVDYNSYGSEIYNEIKAKIGFSEDKEKKLCKKLALRPKDCLYSVLVQDINHFLQTNCDPKTLLALICSIEECWYDDKQEIHIDTTLLKIDETVKRINLWIANSHRFLHHTLKKYSLYYNDFVQPIECAIGMITFGFVGLKNVLEQKRNFIAIFGSPKTHYSDGRSLMFTAFENIMQYPSTEELHLFDKDFKRKSKLLTIFENFENSDFIYFSLLKAKLFEIKNYMEISSEIDEPIFNELNNVLKVMSQMWEEQEERRKKQKLEEESLYVNKTRCPTENEEEVELQEVQENFPTYIEEDFGQFIQQDTLEQVIKTSKIESKSSKSKNVFDDAEFKIIGESFIYIMEHFSRLYYYTPIREKSSQQNLDFITSFKSRMDAFVKLFNQYKLCVNEWLDESLYNTFGLLIGLQQDSLDQISIDSKNSTEVFNFYKDSNIPEIISCTEVLNQIEVRTREQLAKYPDHAVLNDIIRVIQKIRSLPATSPVVRFNAGFQILRQKVAQWNEVAHKNNHLRDLEAQIAEYVQRWTRLELQFWRNCLLQTYDKVESGAYQYWFFIYNLLHEYLAENDTDSAYIDFRNAEKKFEDRELNKEGEKSTKIQTSDVVNVLRQFIEASNYADYFIRIRLLRAFELYLHYLYIENNDRKEALISILHNLQIYFDQFRPEIEESVKSMRAPIEKKLREFVKIESYNKDLSYFSMKNNIARVHRNLNKFLKEYEGLLKTKISKVFQQKENPANDYHLYHDKGINLRYEAKIKYYMIDVKNFIASQKLKDQFVTIDDDSAAALLKRVDKLFVTSRSVVKQAILHAEYPRLIYSLDLLLTDQIETCEHLRKLEVDRSQEKEKQKHQAKNILQQKRKALSDLYKTLTNLGVSFKSGLMELSMESELTDNEIAPFCIKNMSKVTKYKKLDQNLIYLSENLDNYFAKCVFKLKLLQNIMLTPNSELGPLNTDRMKGFSVDMYLLIQKQRKMLSTSIKELYDLRNIISDITALFDSAKACNFNEEQLDYDKTDKNLETLKISLCKICYVLEQFTLLMKCVPEKTDEKNLVLATDNFAISQENSIHKMAVEKTEEILKTTKNLLQDISKLSKLEFVGHAKVAELLSTFDVTLSKIIEVKNLFEIEKTEEYLPAAKPLIDLIKFLIDNRVTDDISSNYEESLDVDKLDTELENIIHSILLSLQKLFKKYSEKDPKEAKQSENVSPKKQENEETQPIHDNHLRDKIHKELSLDLETLNAFNIIQKLSNILVAIKYTKIPNKGGYIKKIASIVPMLEQFTLVGDYFIFQQLGAHKVATKMLSILLTVFVELGTKGFCIPPDLMQDEDGEKQKEDKGGEGFGLEDGTGQNDVSDKIESEDQLDDAKRPEDREGKEEQNKEDCKEEKGIEMSDDFDGKMQDIEKPEDDEDNDKEEEEEEMNKEMGETEEAEKLDDQIWGSDEENNESEDEEDMSDEETGKGTKDEDDTHNNLDSKNEANDVGGDDQQQEGLDATDENNSDKEKKQKKNDIDDMQDPELDEEQINPYHNELEEPPEAEDMELGDNCDLDEDNAKDDENQDIENPFDIDKMKENMQEPEEETNTENEENNENNEQADQSDSETEPEAGTKRNDSKEDENEKEEENNDENEEQLEKKPGEVDAEQEDNENDAQKEETEKQEDEKLDDLHQSEDKSTKEKNVQSMPDDKPKGSDDQIENTENEKDVKQDEDMDVQDTGEDKEGVGVAENDISDRGHQGIAETKETKASEEQEKNSNIKEKRNQGKTNEERTLGEADKNQVKRLKTIDKLKEQSVNEENAEKDKEVEAEEYQHVKEPNKNDRITLDNATEDQSKKIQHLEDEEDDNNNEEENDDAQMEIDNNDENEDELEDVPNIHAEHTEQKSEQPSKSEQIKDKCETTEKMEIEGEIIDTLTVPRSDDTTAHCIKDILMDTSASEELTSAESLELRKIYQDQLMGNKTILPRHDDYETWQSISSKMLPNARDLCEQLRLILEPTKCTRLKGDYRTGRRINMKKIIPYIASQFRKDKIWLRRTKPAQRDYKITIAIDDSKSMHHNNSKALTLQAISLISQALTLLESGKLSILSFGESPQIILNHTDQFDGPKLVKSLNFAQNQSKIAELLNFVRTANSEEGSSGSDNELFENLLIVLSDGRNIYSEGEQKVRDAIKLARLQRIFLVYIIIDNPENKHSILDIRVPQFSADKKTIIMKSYLNVFPFPYYVIVRDLGQLPIVLSEAMRQWFELVNSEQ